MNEQAVKEYWQGFLMRSRGAVDEHTARYQTWGFGHTPEHADGLGGLVLRGDKTATASLIWSYETGADQMPAVGEYSIILDGRGEPMCIIRTTRLEVFAFTDVSAEQAYLEGEGDRSLEYWRKVHWEFFGEECRRIGKAPDLQMPVLCERFELVYRGE